MNKTIQINFQTRNGPQTVNYNLADNEIAQQWFEKIKKLQNDGISLDSEFTSSIYGTSKSYEYYKQQLDNVVDWVNNTTDYRLTKKDHYDQQDLCAMHDVYVEMARDPACDTHNETYCLNKYIHLCEHTLDGPCSLPYSAIAWGTNDGLTMQDFDIDPYKFYTLDIVPGNIYLYWAEVGKKPFEYWYNNDPDNAEHFLSLTRPHVSWSSHCKIALTPAGSKLPAEFVKWFEPYKQPFLDKWHLDDWTVLHEFGAIELATLQDATVHTQLLETFESLESIKAVEIGA